MRSPFAPQPEVAEPHARDVTFALLRNIYRAFDYHTEEDVYDVLTRSVDGQLLDTLYLQLKKFSKCRNKAVLLPASKISIWSSIN